MNLEPPQSPRQPSNATIVKVVLGLGAGCFGMLVLIVALLFVAVQSVLRNAAEIAEAPPPVESLETVPQPLPPQRVMPQPAPTLPPSSLVSQDVDRSLPSFEPREPRWIEQAPEEPQETAQRASAREICSLADRLKSAQRYDDAEIGYLNAKNVDPTWTYPVYQRACNFALSGEPEKAFAELEKAIELGFSGFPTALTDSDIDSLRERPEFPPLLARLREKYMAQGSRDIGTPLAIRPQGDKPAQGWPMILMLHGLGDTNESFIPLAEEWAEHGFIAVTVPGSTPLGDGRYQWSMESIDPTHAELSKLIESDLFANLVNRERVFLLGFSQGALHSLLLTAAHPDRYAGVIAISPGGGDLSKSIFLPKLSPLGKAQCVFIHGTQEPHAPVAARWKTACAKANWKFTLLTHSGGHHLPEDWDEVQLRLMKDFLVHPDNRPN